MNKLMKDLINEVSAKIIYQIDDDDFRKIMDFCRISNHRMMDYGGFVEVLDSIRKGESKDDAGPALAQLFEIQEYIDDFEPVKAVGLEKYFFSK